MKLFWIACVGVVISASACTEQPNTAADYMNRLGNVLAVAAPDTVKNKPLSFPTSREFKRTETKSQLSINDFLAMRRCKLHTVLANKNSSLGRVAPASQRFISDLEVLTSGPACVAQLQQSKQLKLARKLQQHLAAKRASITTSAWEAILGGLKNASFWSSRKQADGYPRSVFGTQYESLEALHELALNLQGNHFAKALVRAQDLEHHLSMLKLGDGGVLLQELNKLNHELARANRILTARLERPLCLSGQATTTARNFQNVVTKYFIGNVQARAVSLKQRHAQLLPRFAKLESTLARAAPAAYQLWQQERDQQFQESLTATMKHAKLLQKLYQQCGLTVGNRVR